MSIRRMTSLEIINTDAFLDMPQSSQLLYFHLNARADDDGFVSNPKSIMRNCGAQNDDLKLLILKKFIISFEDGVCVIKHWRINNYIRKDIYKETKYLNHKQILFIRPNGSYTLNNDGRAIPVPNGHFQVEDIKIENGLIEPKNHVHESSTGRPLRLGKDRLGKDSIDKDKEEKTPTPYELALSFFEGKEVYNEMLDIFSKDNDRSYVDSEFQKFSLYWTEPNKSGTKQRWQQQTTFEIKRRLFTWLGKSKQFSQTLKAKKPIFL